MRGYVREHRTSSAEQYDRGRDGRRRRGRRGRPVESVPTARLDADPSPVTSPRPATTEPADRIQRHAIRAREQSVLGDPPTSAFGGAPDYNALDPSDDGRLLATLPDGYTLQAGQSLFVTEIYTRRERIVDVGELPDVLYASAFF
jgi:hypothetical protein